MRVSAGKHTAVKQFWTDLSALTREFLGSPLVHQSESNPRLHAASRWYAIAKETGQKGGDFLSCLDPVIGRVYGLVDDLRSSRWGLDAQPVLKELIPPCTAPIPDVPVAAGDGVGDFIAQCCFQDTNKLTWPQLRGLDAEFFVSCKVRAAVEHTAKCSAVDLRSEGQRRGLVLRYLAEDLKPVQWLTPLDAQLEDRLLKSGLLCVDDLVHALGLPHFRIHAATDRQQVLLLKYHKSLLRNVAYKPTVAEAFLYWYFEPADASCSHGWTISQDTGKGEVGGRKEVVVPTAALEAGARGGPHRVDILLRPSCRPFYVRNPGQLDARFYVERRSRIEAMAKRRKLKGKTT